MRIPPASPIVMLLLAATLSLPAHATTQRAFVATTGNDANAGVNCSRVSPCRSFAVAIGVTDPGGSVVVLDSGGYGAVTITQAVAIISPPGVHAAITAASGQPGIVVNAPSLAVTLRGLYLEGKGVGTNGIEYHVRDDSTLFVENVVVDGFAGNGIAMVRESALEHATLIVQDCVVRDNGQSGIYLTNGNPADPGPQGSIIVENSRVTHNGFGIVSDGGLAQIRNSIIADGTAGFSSGVWARGNDAATRLLVTGSLVHRWYAGLRSSNSSTIEVGASAVNYNAIGRGKETGGLLVSRTGNVFSADLGEASFDSTLATE